jgi:hypothetical protein
MAQHLKEILELGRRARDLHSRWVKEGGFNGPQNRKYQLAISELVWQRQKALTRARREMGTDAVTAALKKHGQYPLFG